MSDYTYEPTRNEQLTITNSSVVVIQQRNGIEKRKAFVIRNTSSVAGDVITLHIGSAPAVAGAGIVLKQGEVYYESTDAAMECWQGEITAIMNQASVVPNLSIFER